MNAVEIEEAISELSNHPFNHKEFPYQFLIAFGNKSTTIKKLRSGITNKSDLGGVLQRNNIHICTCINGEELSEKLFSLKESKATINSNVKFIVATDGNTLEAEDLITGETISCKYSNLSDYFGFFLPLAGITTVQQIRENSFDIKATSRLNKLYLELIKDNPKWSTKEMKVNLNHFLARLIFCFFAEDTDIFGPNLSFTKTIEQMSSGNTNETNNIISEIFRSMNTPFQDKQDNSFPSWSKKFPYVNGGLFSGDLEVPFFSRISRSYLIHIGNLDWQKINPDIFGSMIQAVSEADERGSLGMHYTSVPNILKVLDPLFLDDIREQLNEAGDNRIKLLNIKKRISKIRVFDPACGSGNFLVIAYKKLREIEAEINAKRREENNRSIIPLTNFRGIEIRGFSAELARLALIIAEYQCNLQYIGQKEALDEFLPLNEENWITTGNALRLNWLDICPPTAPPIIKS